MSAADQSREVAAGGDVRDAALALGRRAAGEPAREVQRAGEVARGVALAAVARPLDEVLAAATSGSDGVDGDRRRVGQEGELPEADAAADADRGSARSCGGGRPATGGSVRRIRPEVGDVLRRASACRRRRGRPDSSAGRPGATPRSIALAKSAALQPPMPSAGSGEMFGTEKPPNGVSSARPPPSRSRSSPSARGARRGSEAQPPAQNSASPRAASPAGSAASSASGRRRGARRRPDDARRAPARATASQTRRRMRPPAVSSRRGSPRGSPGRCRGPAAPPRRTRPCPPGRPCRTRRSPPRRRSWNLASAAWKPAGPPRSSARRLAVRRVERALGEEVAEGLRGGVERGDHRLGDDRAVGDLVLEHGAGDGGRRRRWRPSAPGGRRSGPRPRGQAGRGRRRRGRR